MIDRQLESKLARARPFNTATSRVHVPPTELGKINNIGVPPFPVDYHPDLFESFEVPRFRHDREDYRAAFHSNEPIEVGHVKEAVIALQPPRFGVAANLSWG